MATLEGTHADEGYVNTGASKEGPVLTMMSKRLRALRKKFNRILQIEENKAQGKVVNKEQEEVLKTKIGIAALIDEYEKLRQPLFIAVKEELAEREREMLALSLDGQEEAACVVDDKDAEHKESVVASSSKKDTEMENGGVIAVQPREDLSGLVNGLSSDGASDIQHVEVVDTESHVQVEDVEESLLTSRGALTDFQIKDLLTLLYFSQLFDVRSPLETPSFVWTKVHERSSCLSYDFVRDDTSTPLVEDDLNALSIFGSFLTTRPPNVTLSHKEALERCLEHAKSWLARSENFIGESATELTFSYSGLRERLNRILSSEYFTMMPELTTVSQQTAAAAAAASAAGQYAKKAFLNKAPAVAVISADVMDDPVYCQDVPSQYYQGSEYIPGVSVVVANGVPVPGPLCGVTNAAAFVPQILGDAVDVTQESPDTDAVLEQELPSTQSMSVEQVQPLNQVNYSSGGHRGYHNLRGRVGHAGGRGRGGFPSGRVGRGGRNSHTNGARSDRQFYDEVGNYSRNHNYYGGGRGGRVPRGGYNVYNVHSNSPAQPSPTSAVATGSA